VDEYWVCAHCRSLNRAGTGKCYSCRERYGSAPKADAAKTIAPVATAPLTQAQIPDFSATPLPPPAYSRPVALASPAGPAARSGVGAAASRASGNRPGFGGPVAAVKARVARSLAMRPSVSVGWLGYLSAVLIFLVLIVAAVTIVTVMAVATNLLQHGDIGIAWAQLNPGQQRLVEGELVVTAALGGLALVCFSVFLGFSTHNATGLGADQPLLAPYVAGTCWKGVIMAQVRIAGGLIVPALLLWRNYTIPGLIAAIVAVELAHRHLDSGADWLARPNRHLPDLYAKLGMEGSMSSPMAWAWSGTFRLANGLAIAVWAIPLMAFLFFAGSAITHRTDLLGWQSNGLGPGQIGVALLVVAFLASAAVSMALLVPLTLGLVQRQRTRRTLVRVGKARSWVARPGESGRGNPNRPGTGDFGGYDEDRIVERVTSFNPQEPTGGSIFGGSAGRGDDGPGFGEPGFDAPGFGGPGFGRPIPGPGFGVPTRSAPIAGPGFATPAVNEPLIGRPGLIGRVGGASPSVEDDEELIGGSGIGAPRSPDFGSPGFGRSGPQGPDQASLYSPSTTSSSPWSVEPPVDPE
jgi:hypothetical protein